MDFSGFFSALADSWVSLMSGIASVVLAVIGVLYGYVWKRDLPARALWIAALICFLVASVKVWTAEHRARLEKEAELAKLTKPDFEINHGPVTTSDIERGAGGLVLKHAAVSFFAYVLNHGAPSVIKTMQLTASLPDGTVVIGIPFRYQNKLTITSPDGLPMDVFPGDYLILKGTANPIPTGGQADGFNLFLFPPNMKAQLHEARFVLRVEDASGKFYDHEMGKRDTPPKVNAK